MIWCCCCMLVWIEWVVPMDRGLLLNNRHIVVENLTACIVPEPLHTQNSSVAFCELQAPKETPVMMFPMIMRV